MERRIVGCKKKLRQEIKFLETEFQRELGLKEKYELNCVNEIKDTE